jgi:RES domain-containing protein
MPVGWRILKTKYVASPFDGEGARLNGGRWTSAGLPAVYVADSPALATLEILVHLQSTATLAHYSLVSVAFTEQDVVTVAEASLPPSWRSHPAPPELQGIGDAWLARQSSPVLQVPTVIVPAHSNFILNPAHPRFRALGFGPHQPYRLDERLRRG